MTGDSHSSPGSEGLKPVANSTVPACSSKFPFCVVQMNFSIPPFRSFNFPSLTGETFLASPGSAVSYVSQVESILYASPE